MPNWKIAYMVENAIIEAIQNQVEYTIIGFEDNLIIVKINGNWIKI